MLTRSDGLCSLPINGIMSAHGAVGYGFCLGVCVGQYRQVNSARQGVLLRYA